MEQQLSNEIDVRRNKIETLKKEGVIVYKDKFERTHKISEARKLDLKLLNKNIVCIELFSILLHLQFLLLKILKIIL